MTSKIALVQRTKYLIDACRGASVLHLGCTNHPYTDQSILNDMLLHSKLNDAATELYGFDYDREGIDRLASYGVGNLYQADLEDLGSVKLDRTFDVVVAGEVIEHLNNPGLFLEGIQRFMAKDSRLILTTVNAYSGMRFALYGLRGKGGTAESVHPDHVAYYSYSTLRHLVDRSGMQVTDFLFYDLGTEHRPHNRWWVNLVNDLSVMFTPQLADGVIAVAKKKADAQ